MPPADVDFSAFDDLLCATAVVGTAFVVAAATDGIVFAVATGPTIVEFVALLLETGTLVKVFVLGVFTPVPVVVLELAAPFESACTVD